MPIFGNLRRKKKNFLDGAKSKPQSIISPIYYNGGFVNFDANGDTFRALHATPETLAEMFPEIANPPPLPDDASMMEKAARSAVPEMLHNSGITGFVNKELGTTAVFLQAIAHKKSDANDEEAHFKIARRVITLSDKIPPQLKRRIYEIHDLERKEPLVLTYGEIERVFDAFHNACTADERSGLMSPPDGVLEGLTEDYTLKFLEPSDAPEMLTVVNLPE